jgi:hypothetical protein
MLEHGPFCTLPMMSAEEAQVRDEIFELFGMGVEATVKGTSVQLSKGWMEPNRNADYFDPKALFDLGMAELLKEAGIPAALLSQQISFGTS